MHQFETTGGHARTAGGCGHAVPPAAGGVLHHSETTGGHAVPPAPPVSLLFIES
ncbi:MAG: hypothetical protein LBD24_05905 [Spirochaetaceae bacterium]|nr:hypothetical protein [Spirochaetaceae bacterium]